MKERAKKILPVHLRKTISFDKLTNVIYAIACAIKTSMSKKKQQQQASKEKRTDCEMQTAVERTETKSSKSQP